MLERIGATRATKRLDYGVSSSGRTCVIKANFTRLIAEETPPACRSTSKRISVYCVSDRRCIAIIGVGEKVPAFCTARQTSIDEASLRAYRHAITGATVAEIQESD